MTASLTLPWPPSVNRYWRHNRGRTHISKEGRDYRVAVADAVVSQRVPSFGVARVGVRLTCIPPDRRRRDLDNLTKGLLDALEDAGVFDDDSQIDEINLLRSQPPEKPGRVEVEVWKL